MESPSLSPEAIAFAARIYDAARAGQIDIFEQALPAGLPANMTNEKGDSLVSAGSSYFNVLMLSLFYFLSLFCQLYKATPHTAFRALLIL